jgi:hypothetical protein
MLQWREKRRGDLRFKSGLKIVVMGGMLLLEFAQIFSRGEGGIGCPNSPYGALGSPQKNSHNLLAKNFNFKSSWGLPITFSYCYDSFVRAIMYLKYLDGAKKFYSLNRKTYKQFWRLSPGISAIALRCGTLLGLGKIEEKWVWTRRVLQTTEAAGAKRESSRDGKSRGALSHLPCLYQV